MCRNASAEEWTAGSIWYRIHGTAIVQEGSEAGLNREQSLAIFACISPKCRISDNWKKYRFILEDKDCSRVWYATDHMKNKVAATLSGHYDLAYVLSGDKVSSFYQNLDGAPSAVTVDTWCADVVDGGRIKRPNLKGAAYDYYAEHYRVVAEILGIDNCVAQALLWLLWRKSLGFTDDGSVPTRA